jgi:hypothetical protein
MARSSLACIPDFSVKFFFQLIYTDIEISSIVHCCFSKSQNELKFEMQLHGKEYPRIISAKFGGDWLSSFRGEDFF